MGGSAAAGAVLEHRRSRARSGVRLRVRPGVDDILDELSRDLHDQVAQSLHLLLVEMERFKLDQSGRASVLHEVEFLQAATRQALSNLRRVLFDLRAEVTPVEDLEASLADLRQRIGKLGVEHVEVSVSPDWPPELPADVGIHVLRIVQEATANAVRHSGCTVLEIELSSSGDYLIVTVRDDGRGFDPYLIEIPTFGMRSMRERAGLLGGDLTIDSNPDRGTAVMLTVPWRRE